MRPLLVPELLVTDIQQSLNFYTKILGFGIYAERKEEGFAEVFLADVHIMLDHTAALHAVTDLEFVTNRQWRTAEMQYPFGRGINLEITIPDINLIYSSLQNNNYPIKFPMEEKSYRVNNQLQGVKQFLVLDPDGYLLRFATNFAKKDI